MNTESVIRMDEEPSQPLVDWYPPGGPLRAVSSHVTVPVAAGVSAVALGVLVYAGFMLAQKLYERSR